MHLKLILHYYIHYCDFWAKLDLQMNLEMFKIASNKIVIFYYTISLRVRERERVRECVCVFVSDYQYWCVSSVLALMCVCVCVCAHSQACECVPNWVCDYCQNSWKKGLHVLPVVHSLQKARSFLLWKSFWKKYKNDLSFWRLRIVILYHEPYSQNSLSKFL